MWYIIVKTDLKHAFADINMFYHFILCLEIKINEEKKSIVE